MTLRGRRGQPLGHPTRLGGVGDTLETYKINGIVIIFVIIFVIVIASCFILVEIVNFIGKWGFGGFIEFEVEFCGVWSWGWGRATHPFDYF